MTQGFEFQAIKYAYYHKSGEMEVNFCFFLGSQNRHFMTRLPVPFSPNDASVLVAYDLLIALVVPGLGGQRNLNIARPILIRTAIEYRPRR